MDKTSEEMTHAGSSYALYSRIVEQMTALCAKHTSNVKQLTNCVWLVVCVLNGGAI